MLKNNYETTLKAYQEAIKAEKLAKEAFDVANRNYADKKATKTAACTNKTNANTAFTAANASYNQAIADKARIEATYGQHNDTRTVETKHRVKGLFDVVLDPKYTYHQEPYFNLATYNNRLGNANTNVTNATNTKATANAALSRATTSFDEAKKALDAALTNKTSAENIKTSATENLNKTINTLTQASQDYLNFLFEQAQVTKDSFIEQTKISIDNIEQTISAITKLEEKIIKQLEDKYLSSTETEKIDLLFTIITSNEFDNIKDDLIKKLLNDGINQELLCNKALEQHSLNIIKFLINQGFNFKAQIEKIYLDENLNNDQKISNINFLQTAFKSQSEDIYNITEEMLASLKTAGNITDLNSTHINNNDIEFEFDMIGRESIVDTDTL